MSMLYRIGRSVSSVIMQECTSHVGFHIGLTNGGLTRGGICGEGRALYDGVVGIESCYNGITKQNSGYIMDLFLRKVLIVGLGGRA